MMSAGKVKGTKQGEKSKILDSLSRERFSFLLATFLALLSLFLLLLRNTPEGQHLLIAWQAKRINSLSPKKFQEALRRDPNLGFPFEKVGLNLVQNQSKPVLLVVLGKCEGCNEKVVREWVETLCSRETLRKEFFGVLVVQDGIEKVEKVVKGSEGVKLVADKDGSIARTLNAFFLPRAYGFVGGKLVWLQRETNIGVVGVLEGFLNAMKGKEKAREILNAWSTEMREKTWGKEMVSFVKGGRKSEIQ